MSESRNVRRRLEQFLKNPACEANALSVVLDVSMRSVAESEGELVRESQSPYALRRGLGFEKSLFDDDAANLRTALAKAAVLPSEDAVVVDLRLARNGGGVATVEQAKERFLRWLSSDGERRRKAHVFIAPALEAPAADVLGEGSLAPDLVVALPCDGGRWSLSVGEVKVYPDRGGHTDASDLAATRAQAGLYLLALERCLERVGNEAITAESDGFLVLSWAGTNRASVRAQEPLAFQARSAARGIERLRALAPTLQAAQSSDGKRRLSLIVGAPTSLRESCAAFCARATVCHREACASADPRSLGDAAAKSLGGISLHRAVELLSGASADNDAERAMEERFAPLRALVR